MNMVLCFNNEDKNKLLSSGYTFLREVEYENMTGYLFCNDGQQTDFSESKLLYTDESFF